MKRVAGLHKSMFEIIEEIVWMKRLEDLKGKKKQVLYQYMYIMIQFKRLDLCNLDKWIHREKKQ